MPEERAYQKTIYACFTGYIVQAVVNNFVPLLFLTLQSEFGIPLSKITFLITFNFAVQLLVDLGSTPVVERLGVRASMVLAHLFAAAGLILLTVLPELTPDPFAGILISVMIYALGGGLLEVLVSPVVESCPTDNKETAMSLLHSFYCWGQAGVVLLSTVFFALAGIRNWRILAVIWSVLPVINMIAFMRVPLRPFVEEGEKGKTIRELFRNGSFWMLFVMMLCAGASEQAVSQWASEFAEAGLGVTKTLGDLMGPMLFALLMGSARLIFGKCGARLDLHRYMMFSGLLCVIGYLMIAFVPNPVIALLGCGVTGFAVGIFWPGTFSLASAGIKNGGTLMFALLALAGDLGCGGGPTLAGQVAAFAGDNLRIGILSAIIFPAGMCVCLLMRKGRRA